MKIFNLILILCLMSGSAFAGREGNGVENGKQNHRAWFLDKDRTIHYCVMKTSNFGFTDQEVDDLIVKSFKTWSNYNVTHTGNTYSFASKIERQDLCDDSEDLKFYFGVINNQIKADMPQYVLPRAFAELENYDLLSRWGKGHVWLIQPGTAFYAPKQWAPEALEATILHEMGHIFGCSHVPGTIMDDELSKYLTWSSQNFKSMNIPYSHIDWQRELIAWPNNLMQVVWPYNSADQYMKNWAFQTLLNRDAIGESSEEFVIENASSFEAKGKLVLTDSKEKVEFPFLMNMQNTITRIGQEFTVFTQDSPTGATSYNSYGSIESATLELPDGKTLPILYKRNMNVLDAYSYYQVELWVTAPNGFNGQSRLIFRANNTTP